MTAMPDQATALRRLAHDFAPTSLKPQANGTSHATAGHGGAKRRAPQRASVFAITSGKGGVGKSNIAVNLACKFAQAGKRVLLIDADLGLANADVLCGIEAPYNLSHVLAGRKTMREVVVKTPAGFDLLAGASGLSRMADLDDAGRQVLLTAIQEIERLADVVLIDTGAGVSSNVLAFCRAADHVLVVTTPEPTAVTDAYAMVKCIGTAADRRVSLLVNQVSGVTEANAIYDRIAKVARQFLSVNLLDAGHVLRDDEMTRAVRRRMPLMLCAPTSDAARSISQLAFRLEPGLRPDNATGFFRRLLNRTKGAR